VEVGFEYAMPQILPSQGRKLFCKARLCSAGTFAGRKPPKWNMHFKIGPNMAHRRQKDIKQIRNQAVENHSNTTSSCFASQQQP